MSLINQVLRDLDARQAAAGGLRPLPSEVRPLIAAINRMKKQKNAVPQFISHTLSCRCFLKHYQMVCVL